MKDFDTFVSLHGLYKCYKTEKTIKVKVYIYDINSFINNNNILILKIREGSETFLAYKNEVTWYNMATSSFHASYLDCSNFVINGCQFVEKKDLC